MSSYQTRGIILRKTDWGETGQLFSIYTKDYGKVEAVARGSKKIQSKLNSHLQFFADISVMIARGKTIDQLAGAQMERKLLPGDLQLQKIILGSYLIELLDHLTQVHQADGRVYQLLSDQLDAIGTQLVLAKKDCAVFQRTFTIKLLTLLGYQPPAAVLAQDSLKPFLDQHLNYELRIKKFVRGLALDDWLPVC